MALPGPGDELALPPPVARGTVSLEEAIAVRRSVRRYSAEPLTLAQLSQVLWAAQGITHGRRFRAAPSAGAIYPLEVFVVAGGDGVTGLAAGVYRYVVEGHSLERHRDGDYRQGLVAAAAGQRFIAQAPLDIVLCAHYGRTLWRYGGRAERYVHMEVGHVGENIHLQAAALGLATVMVGAFEDDEVATALAIEEGLAPLYILPLGRPL